MIIAGDKTLLLASADAIKIFGMPYMTFIIVLVIVLGVGALLFYLLYQARKRAQYNREAAGRVLCEFTSVTGGLVRRELCEEYKGEVKKIETKSRATFMSSQYAKPPTGHAIDAYYLLPEHDHLDLWPPGKNPMQQVTVKKYYFTENDPCPKIPRNPEKWDAERYTRITATIAKLAKDESNLQVLVSEMSGVWQNIADFVTKLKRIDIIVIMLIVMIVIQLISGYLSFQTNSTAGAIARFLLGGK